MKPGEIDFYNEASDLSDDLRGLTKEYWYQNIEHWGRSIAERVEAQTFERLACDCDGPRIERIYAIETTMKGVKK